MARPAAIADDSVQPVPCVFAVSICSAASRATAFGVDQQVDRFRALRMPALDQHRLRAEREQPLGLLAHLGFVARERLIEQRGGFRQVRRDDQRARNQRRA